MCKFLGRDVQKILQIQFDRADCASVNGEGDRGIPEKFWREYSVSGLGCAHKTASAAEDC